MEIEPNRVISIGVIITIRRAEDDYSNPCIFRWNFLHHGWGPSGFMIFQRTRDGLKKAERKHKSPPPQTFRRTGYEVETEELLPSQTLRRNIGHPYPVWDHLVARERYELFWPGAEHALWAWGTLREHWDQEIGVNMGLSRVIIPGGACCSLTGVEEEDLSDS
ncbi:unnamed protein product [Penicillium egyptiacum]|uniref:Uncharacterized protein n=1 Tax=Penicillium egyptiacum TaxID=1303716 RepID=A0A9W4K507_9EURO|nr:unnamed protein product [Penicillium egyptiacum]